MKVLHVSPTYYECCGIGNFSRSLERALRAAGVDVATTTYLAPENGCDVVLVQHEWGLFPHEEDLLAYCGRSNAPVALFAHSGGVETFATNVQGFIAMHEGIVRAIERRSLVIPHPAWAPHTLEDRRRLRERFGLGQRRLVVGSSGFITGFRQFPEIVSRLLPVLRDVNGTVELMISRVGGPWYSETKRVEADLDQLRREYKGCIRFDGRFLSNEELNLRLQACDLLWCFTNRASSAYASGSAADQYASGTAMVVSEVEQHRQVLNGNGVVSAPADLDGFVDVLLTAIEGGQFPRHAPCVFSWTAAAQQVRRFLEDLIN
jgi:glycosyltransferase involved in cell wall biosynthesis